MQDWIVARQLYGTPGIAEVNSFGGQLKQYEVAVNPDRMVAMGISIPEIFSALEKTMKTQEEHTLIKTQCLFYTRSWFDWLI